MSPNDEPVIDGPQGERTPPDKKGPPVEDKIRDLAENQLFGILCTQAEKQPYGSMIGFAFTEDLKYAVFATPKATRKYNNLTGCQNVALVVNDREKHPTDLMKIQAFTATGIADEITDNKTASKWAKILVNKQSYLKKFVESESTALFRIRILRYFYVCSFQEVREWRPE